MSSSDGAHAPGRVAGPAFVLINPQMGENIGAAMRVMANFGLDDLRVFAPRDGWPNERAEAMSAGSPLYASARVTDDLEQALEGCTVLYATTARPRGMVKPVMTAREAMSEARGLIEAGQRPGFLFGAEKSGLPNELVARSRAILTLPVNPQFASLNLSMAVGVLAHEWRAGDPAPEEFKPLEEPADAVQLVRMYEHFEDELERAGFFFPPEKKPLMTQNLRNIFARAGLTEQEVRTFRGAIKALTIGRGKARIARD
ncbi:MAG: RNA methyltransferase [Caulobacterales bacterium]|uniref:RNA methyltransferase n=1 Tax=Glycocaulis sp. TaxID=1969725 RepID=UPI003F9F4EFA